LASLSMDELASAYGYSAAFFNSDAELQSLIQQAVAGQWTADKFRAAFMASNWYRTHSAEVRTWLEEEARDPASVKAQIDQRVLQLSQRASQEGITISDSRLREIAHDSLMYGWTDEQLSKALATEWHYQEGQTAGEAATLQMRVGGLASDYGVDVTGKQLGDWIGGSLEGRYTEDNLRDFVRDIAVSKYPGLSDQLNAGFTVRQIATPYVMSYSRIMEVDPDTADLGEPAIQRALQGVPGVNGQPPVRQTVYDFERSLRKDPRWLQTENARMSMQSATTGILRDMGIYG